MSFGLHLLWEFAIDDLENGFQPVLKGMFGQYTAPCFFRDFPAAMRILQIIDSLFAELMCARITYNLIVNVKQQ